jgi:hypothetical protein
MYLSLSYPYSGYALQTAGIRTLWDMGNDVFRYQLEQCPELLDRILTGLLETVENIRYGYGYMDMCMGMFWWWWW